MLQPGMRISRGVLAAIGASTSLIAAGALALLVVSAVVAFKGWPDIRASGVQASTTQVALQVDPAPRVTQVASRTIVVPEPAARPARTAEPGSAVLGTRETGSTGSGTNRADSHAGAPTGATDKPPADKPPAAGDPVRNVVQGTTNTTSQTVKSLGDSVRPVSPQLADTVDQVNTVLNETLSGLGETVAGVLDAIGGGNPQP